MNLVEGVAEAKLGSAWPFRDPAREDRLLVRLRQSAVEEGLDPHEVERLYRVILDMSVAHQQAFVRALETTPLRVTYQGAEGSYSHLAAQRQYSGRPGGVLLTGCETFRRAAEAVLSGEADLALLPIENTTAGSINETYDLLGEGGLAITGEVIAAIEHCLLGLPGTTVAELTAALSHPQALWQCEGFFRAHPHIRPQAEFDTAGAARKVKESGDRALGAIASFAAAGDLRSRSPRARHSDPGRERHALRRSGAPRGAGRGRGAGEELPPAGARRPARSPRRGPAGARPPRSQSDEARIAPDSRQPLGRTASTSTSTAMPRRPPSRRRWRRSPR